MLADAKRERQQRDRVRTLEARRIDTLADDQRDAL